MQVKIQEFLQEFELSAICNSELRFRTKHQENRFQY
ncbi:hypothetical protein T06_9382 [Trichinella sp. T6]|nr:hypothetical protein T06_9382 [Trichinella sp. T6]